MQEGERIHVQTKNFEGMATILYIAPGEFYPVQVEMDQPDKDGHKIQRITWVEIVKGLKEDSVPEGITFQGPDDPQQYIGEIAQETGGYNFRTGQQFLLGVIRFPGVYKAGAAATSFYVYDPETMRFKGCMPADMFQIIGPCVEGQSVRKIKTMEQEQLKTSENMALAVEMVGTMKYEQLSILDFL